MEAMLIWLQQRWGKVVKELHIGIQEVMSLWNIRCWGGKENKESWKSPECLT